jgi:antitoxin ParD1/3/4
MTVELPPQLEAKIRQKIETGPYNTVGDVIEEALTALDERDRLHALREKLQVGLDQLDRGEGIPFTAERRAASRLGAARRAAAGDLPNPDVCP